VDVSDDDGRWCDVGGRVYRWFHTAMTQQHG
jgi:hypothetical protein